MKMRYVLLTAARNESGYIERSIDSVISQSILPTKWIVVSDGSTDNTDEIVMSYENSFDFIKLIRIEDNTRRNFASQAYALNHALSAVWLEEFQFIGCLDADIVLEPDYYENLFHEFSKNIELGIAGGSIYEKVDGYFKPRLFNSKNSVAGAIQMFRKDCFEKIGTFTPTPHGGLDTVAEIRAKMYGFKVESFPGLPVYHLRRTGAGSGRLSGSFKSGFMDYEIGYHPLFEIFVCARRVRLKIKILSSVIRFIGFIVAYMKRFDRLVTKDMRNYLRKEQMFRLKEFFKSVFSYLQFDRRKK